MAQHSFSNQDLDASNGVTEFESFRPSPLSETVPFFGVETRSSTWPMSRNGWHDVSSDHTEGEYDGGIDNPTQDAELEVSNSGSTEPLVFEPIDAPSGYTPLTFRPKILTRRVLLAVASFYLANLGLLAYLIYCSRYAKVWTIRNVNYYLAARYLPVVIGVCTKALFSTTTSTLRRMLPFIHLTDQKNTTKKYRLDHTVCARYFPLTPGWNWTIGSLILSNYVFLFTLGVKASLFRIQDTGQGVWLVSVRQTPAVFLCFTYLLATSINVFIATKYAGCSTGLKENWDPTSLADIILLFTPADTVPTLSHPLNHFRWYRMFCNSKTRYRLGYWKILGTTEPTPPIIYGLREIGTITPTENARHLQCFNNYMSQMSSLTPYCRYCERLRQLPARHLHQSAVFRDAMALLLLKVLPILIANLAGASIEALDIHHRWVQPFTNMYEKESPASDSLLLDYMTVSPLEVIPQAWANGHFRVVYFGVLSALKWISPLVMTGLCAVNETGSGVVVQLSPAAASLTIIWLSVYIYSLMSAWSPPKRRLPRNVGSLYDFFCFFYDSQLRWYPGFAGAAFSRNITKDELHSQLRLVRDKFSFGLVGDPQQRHPGFDSSDHVTWVPPVPGIYRRVKNVFKRHKDRTSPSDRDSDPDSEYDAIPLDEFDASTSTHHRGPLIRGAPQSTGHSTAVD